ncbi:uncharacterized protein LOC129768067 isoform X2 [Toxorhynchites rutilus septentrionalis]|uniref:uncharacterized protein LOC129768067 isoform X2 n=1 Tax=Toxorhynchites rutilus septentrionalis TaxID=329112 RepID=UPI002478B563|nr:uncharacterized protein LOC129768067 isoform X2 [Toxorhynchites rutilus septentrionalis]
MHMHMSFWWGSDVGDVFFKGLTVNSTGAMVALCLVLVALSILYEGMKVHGAKVRARAARERKRSSSCPPSENATLLSLEINPGIARTLTRRLCVFFAEATVFLMHNMLGYALMLMVMFYNGYLFVAVVGGMALGYFLFGHKSMKVNMENVQARQTNVICTARCLQTAESCAMSHSAPCPSSRPQPNRSNYQTMHS